MAKIDRRRFLASLAATTACTGIVPSPIRAEAITRPYDVIRFDERYGSFLEDYWFIKREYVSPLNTVSKVAGRVAVDFWSRPYCELAHADYLPPEIPTGVLYYDPIGNTHLDQGEALKHAIKHIESVHKKHRPDANDQFAVHTDGIETLASTLWPVIHNEPSSPKHSRTALVALDSLGASPRDPEWNGILPVLARCYDRIVGHLHVNCAGLREWKEFCDSITGEDEESFFALCPLKAVSLCDVVIVTSSGLLEADPGLSSRASTETQMGELIQNFGYAIMDRESHDLILDVRGNEKRRKPRLFALGSVTSYTTVDSLNALSKTLRRQRDLVCSSFGDVVSNEPSLVIATLADEMSAAIVEDLFMGSDRMSFLKLATLPFGVPNPSLITPVCLLTLWQFDANFDRRAVS